MHKKSQIQIGETIAVLFVFFILISIGFIFYAKVIKSNIELEKEELTNLKSIEVAQKVMFLPELQCSKNIVTEVQNCVDKLKLEAAKGIIRENELHYFDLFEFSEINVTQIYPVNADGSETIWYIYSRKIDDFKNRFITNVPVSIYNPIERTYSFGILSIETLSK